MRKLPYLAAMGQTFASTHLISATGSALLVIDVQKRLVPALIGAQSMIEGIGLLARTGRSLGVPLAVTEHCPDQIGRTVEDLADDLAHGVVVEKQHFAAVNAPAFASVMQAWRDRTIILCGAESHVCVAQSALGLLDAGHRVGVVRDAIAARHDDDHQAALARLTQAGVVPFSVEMLLTEWLGDARRPEFKPTLRALKQRHDRRSGS